MTLSELKSSKVFELRKIAKGLGVERKRDGNYKTVETLRSEIKRKVIDSGNLLYADWFARIKSDRSPCNKG